MPIVQNPILTGFNPDPSICCVGDDFYIATSTFEYAPGVQIHHSKDLINWQLIAHPLQRTSQLDMVGNPSSGGIWAPCLTHHDGKFWLIYTDVKKWKGRKSAPMHDQFNYLVTCDTIDGEWSEPIYLNGAGFDPSLFHDDDGKKWYVQMEWDYRAIPTGSASERDAEHEDFTKYFNGIWLQEYDHNQQKLVGERYRIFDQTPIGFSEGPHIYKVNGQYHLMLAEGGTSYLHAVTMARSNSITGPYELHPQNPIVTSVNNPKLKLQKAGHASMCEAKDGKWYLVHLCGRPLTELGNCVLGRETAIQPIKWVDGWPWLDSDNNEPLESFEVPDYAPGMPAIEQNINADFDSKDLSIHLQSLRIYKDPSWVTVNEVPSHLRLYGQDSPTSNFRQSVIVKRQQHFNFDTETAVKFNPEHYMHMAGLMYRYNEENFYYAHVSHNEEIGKHISIVTFRDDVMNLPLHGKEIPVHKDAEVFFKLEVRHDKAQFYYSLDKTTWNPLHTTLDTDIMSDEFAFPMGFTGAFVAMSCNDMTGHKHPADFDYFKYIVKD